MIRMWYPAGGVLDASSVRHYGFHTEANEFAYEGELAAALAAAKVPSRTYQDADPLQDGRTFPVIFYSHGAGGAVEENETLFESLAERGYVVVSIGHTLDASMVTLDDGRVVTESDVVDADYARTRDEDPAMSLRQDDIQRLIDTPFGQPIPEDVMGRHRYTYAELPIGWQEHLDLWVQDTNFVLRVLTLLNDAGSGTPFEGLLDLDRVGAFGWSFGGATSRRFCNQEPRCRASINLDGSSYARMGEGISDPHLEFAGDIAGRVNDFLSEGGPPNLAPQVMDEAIAYRAGAAHSAIAEAENSLFLLELTESGHGDFVGGWFEQHDFGPGVEARFRALEGVVVRFFDACLDDALDPSPLCAFLAEASGIGVTYDNACGD